MEIRWRQDRDRDGDIDGDRDGDDTETRCILLEGDEKECRW